MKFSRLLASAIAGAALLAACGGGAESSDTTERTRNTTLPSDVNTVAFIAGTDGTGTKIYKATLRSAGPVTMEEVLTDASGTNTGIVGLAIDTVHNSLFWATQDGSDAKIRTAQFGSESTYTLYSYPGGYPLGLSYDTANDVLGVPVQAGATSTFVLGNSEGATSGVTISSVANIRGVTGISGEIYGLSGTSFYRWSTATGAGMKVEAGAGTQAWSSIIDEMNGKAYYAINYETTPTIMKANQTGAGSPSSYLSTPYGVVAMAMKGDGSLVWVNGQRAGYSPPADDSSINVVDPTDSTRSSVYTPTSAIKATSIWLVESPSTSIDPSVSGGGFVGNEYTCDDAVWEGDLPGQRLSRAPQLIKQVQWYMDGVAISGATGWSYIPESGGELKCAVTATNLAGFTVAESLTTTVVDSSTTTLGVAGSDTTVSTSSTTIALPTTTVPTYKSISMKWSYSSSKKTLTATFKKVSGARTYYMGLTGATKKTIKCTTSGTKVTCKATLKKGANSITINAKNSAKAIVAQKKASKTVR